MNRGSCLYRWRETVVLFVFKFLGVDRWRGCRRRFWCIIGAGAGWKYESMEGRYERTGGNWRATLVNMSRMFCGRRRRRISLTQNFFWKELFAKIGVFVIWTACWTSKRWWLLTKSQGITLDHWALIRTIWRDSWTARCWWTWSMLAIKSFRSNRVWTFWKRELASFCRTILVFDLNMNYSEFDCKSIRGYLRYSSVKVNLWHLPPLSHYWTAFHRLY